MSAMRRGLVAGSAAAAIAVSACAKPAEDPQESQRREETSISLMKFNLRDLATAEDVYHKHSGTYVAAALLPNFVQTENVSVTVLAATRTGWSAVAHHPGTARTCAFFLGTAPPPIAGEPEGHPECTP